MTTHGGRIVRRFSAAAACLGMACALAACSSTAQTGSDRHGSTTTVTGDPGTVAIFTPSDGVTISGNTPLNKWTAFVPALSKALRDRSFAKDSITTSTADSLDQQSRDVQDYIVNRISSSRDGSAAASTIVVAPVVDADDTTRQYGDLVGHEQAQSSKAESGTDGSSAADDADDATGSAASADSSSDAADYSSDDEAAADRLVSALALAKENGMHVVMLADTMPSIEPDAYVRMSTAEQIGRIQATKLVEKLALDKVSKDNPKHIEVLLPYSPSDADDDQTSASSSSGDADGKTDVTEDGEAFAAAAFKGVWSVLKPYFESGQAVSPSLTLTTSTTSDDWRDVAFVSGKEDTVRAELRGRLGLDDASAQDAALTRIDGVIAMNDYAAAGVVKELGELGYTGSAADINPQITISGIVENITGRKDLVRGRVPDPIKAPDSDEDATSPGSSDEQSGGDDADSRWPIVTGYGAYVDSMPRIVAGQQWMTAMENRQSLAENTAQVCQRLNTVEGKAWKDGLTFLSSTKVNGKATPTVSEELLAVSASNLKAALIDPGYISLADAGL